MKLVGKISSLVGINEDLVGKIEVLVGIVKNMHL